MSEKEKKPPKKDTRVRFTENHLNDLEQLSLMLFGTIDQTAAAAMFLHNRAGLKEILETGIISNKVKS